LGIYDGHFLPSFESFFAVFSNKFGASSLLLSLDFVVILCNDLGTSFLEVLL